MNKQLQAFTCYYAIHLLQSRSKHVTCVTHHLLCSWGQSPAIPQGTIKHQYCKLDSEPQVSGSICKREFHFTACSLNSDTTITRPVTELGTFAAHKMWDIHHQDWTGILNNQSNSIMTQVALWHFRESCTEDKSLLMLTGSSNSELNTTKDVASSLVVIHAVVLHLLSPWSSWKSELDLRVFPSESTNTSLQSSCLRGVKLEPQWARGQHCCEVSTYSGTQWSWGHRGLRCSWSFQPTTTDTKPRKQPRLPLLSSRTG